MNTGDSMQTSDSTSEEYDFPPPNLARQRRRIFVLCMVVATGFVAVLNVSTTLDGRLLAGDLQKYQWRSVALAATIGVAALGVPLLRSSRRGLVAASVLFIAMVAQLTYLMTVVVLLPKDFPKFTTREQRETARGNRSRGPDPKLAEDAKELVGASNIEGPEFSDAFNFITDAPEPLPMWLEANQRTSTDERTSRDTLPPGPESPFPTLSEEAKELVEAFKSGSPEFSDSPAPAEDRASPAKSGRPEFR